MAPPPTRIPRPRSSRRSRLRAARAWRTGATSVTRPSPTRSSYAALDTWGRLDVVINNAGFGRPRMVFNLSDEEWDDVIRVHLRGTFVVSRAVCRHWRVESKARNGTYGRSDQHGNRLAPLRRCRSVELRRGQGGNPGVHRSDRDRDGAARRDCEHDHARREHAARADRLAHGARRRARADTEPPTASIRATRCTWASSARTWRHPTPAGSRARRSRCGAGPSNTSRRGRCATRPAPRTDSPPPTISARFRDCSVRRRNAPIRRPPAGKRSRSPPVGSVSGREMRAVRPLAQSDFDFSDFLESSSSD